MLIEQKKFKKYKLFWRLITPKMIKYVSQVLITENHLVHWENSFVKSTKIFC